MWRSNLVKAFLTPSLSRKFVLKRPLLKLLSPLKGKHLIEFGCGSGYWTRIFRDHRARCVGVDISRRQIELAREHNSRGIIYIEHDAATFRSRKKFDIVFIDHLLADTRYPRKIVRILRHARALLRRGGVLVLSEIHPSVADFPFMHMMVPRNYFYFKSGAVIRFKLKLGNGRYISVRDYHWTLGDLSTFLHKAGFCIERIIEPRAPKNKMRDNYLRERYKFPSHILIRVIPMQGKLTNTGPEYY